MKVFNRLTLGYADKADDVRVFENKSKFDKGKVQGMRNTRKVTYICDIHDRVGYSYKVKDTDVT